MQEGEQLPTLSKFFSQFGSTDRNLAELLDYATRVFVLSQQCANLTCTTSHTVSKKILTSRLQAVRLGVESWARVIIACDPASRDIPHAIQHLKNVSEDLVKIMLDYQTAELGYHANELSANPRTKTTDVDDE